MTKLRLFSSYLIKSFFLLLPVFHEAQAAYHLSIINRQYLNGAASAILDPIANDLETLLNYTFTSSDNTDFLRNVGNANAVSTRSYLAPGTFTDTNGSISFAVSCAFSGGSEFSIESNALPPVGIAAQSGITLSYNGESLKIFTGLDPKKVLYHFSFYSMDFPSFLNTDIKISSIQFSTGLSYQLFSPVKLNSLVSFNGVRLTSGFSYGSFNGSFRIPFNITSGGDFMQSDVSLAVNSKVYTFSNEATLAIRVLYFLDLYMGAGIDFNLGNSTLTASNSNGSVSATDNTGVTVFNGDIDLSGTPETASPTFTQMRLILGTQMNLGPIAVFSQLQVSTPNVYSINLGAKLIF